MNSIKAIIVGSLFIIIASLFFQLAYLFIAVEYNSLAKSLPFLNEIRGVFRYLVGIPIFMLIMFAGGYVTADMVQTRVILHCLVVGLIAAGGMLWLALANSELTLSGIVLFIMSLAAVMAGGWYWQRDDKTTEEPDAQDQIG